MEKAKLKVIQSKKGELVIRAIFTESGREMPVPKIEYPDIKSLDGKEVEIQRVNGPITRVVLNGTIIFQKSQVHALPATHGPEAESDTLSRNITQSIDHTENITDPAHAPYNFVPLNSVVVESEGTPGEDNFTFDKYHHDKHTGYIGLTIETKTPLYICDTLTEVEMREKERMELDGEKYINPEFFSPGDNIRIPGSSLRGMIRTLVEIMSFGKFGFSEKGRKFHYRSFMDKSFKLKEAYNSKMVAGDPNGGYSQKVKAGYLIKDGFDYKIKPAEVDSNGSQYYRVEEDDVITAGVLTERMSQVVNGDRKENPNYEIWFRKVRFIADPPTIHNYSVRLKFSKITRICAINNAPPNSKEGTLVHTGWVGNPRKGKHLHWVIGPSSHNEIPISQEVIKDYKGDKNRDEDMNLLKWLEIAGIAEVPCFYIQENGSVKSFGHTGFFRLAYDKKVEDFVYICDEHKKDLRDIPTAIFGNEKDFSGRVFFEDAAIVLKNGQTEENILLDKKQPKILSTPKPTTFNHYLCQPETPEPVFKNITEREFNYLLNGLSQEEQELLKNNFNSQNRRNGNIYIPNNSMSGNNKIEIHKMLIRRNAIKHIREFNKIRDWNSNGCIRGNKLYWHRSGSDWVDPEVQDHTQKDKQHTIIRPVKDGVIFSGIIRFENLSKVELGALLFTLDLPSECCHKLGMGKALGLGSVKIASKLSLSNRENRYKDLFAEWDTPIQKATQEDKNIVSFKKEFAEYILKKIGEDTTPEPVNKLWSVERMNELRVMLNFELKPYDGKTRYMSIKPVNEFKERRVLPKPSKV